MNIGEGLRRLGIVLGVVGILLGAIYGYEDARAVWSLHIAHQRFESLMTSPTMLRVVKAAKDQVATLSDLAADPDFSKLSDDERKYILGRALSKGLAPSSAPPPQTAPPGSLHVVRSEPLPGGQGDVMDVLVNLDEFREVMVDKSGRISTIVLSTGESVPNIGPPTLTAFVLLLLYPLGGFLAPWGAIRAFAWLIAGFLSGRT